MRIAWTIKDFLEKENIDGFIIAIVLAILAVLQFRLMQNKDEG